MREDGFPASRLARAARDALADGAALAGALPGFRPRPAQQRLAAAVADAFEHRDILLAEAGTGTGKTFAYLVPALLSGMKTIVSTGTRALQDQLYLRDLPRVRDALGVGLKTALLKGRANYLCRYRMEQAKGEPRFSSKEQVSQFQRVVAWSGRTRMGDMAELDSLPEDSPLLPLVTSTADNCLGTDCPFWGDCFVVQARQRAQAADLVVVNHHLLLADLALKQEGFGEILPGAQAFVVDEAHQLPDLAAQFFGEGLGARPLVELARDAIGECKDVPGALASVQEPARALEQAARALRAGMDNLPMRGTAWRALDEVDIEPAFRMLADALHAMEQTLEPLREAAPGFDACHLRARDQLGRLRRWLGEAAMGGDDDSDGTSVHWYELTPRGFRLQRTPLDVSAPLRRHREESHAAWVFTSATLAVGGNFTHIAHKLGIVDAQELIEPSPFDWDSQALCYLPPRLPEPASRDYGRAVIDALMPVLEASGGRAFLLFASHRALREAAELLRDAPWPLFVQGSEPRHVLLQRFRDSGNGVLLGTASFREGVDVAG
ncbi:MAG: ATP-dependent DNA helicase, partial [Thermomonas sp.]|uniref:ATP-dependent DNA helicase n=1 Tax=Thermomonas sp. TaxID=1971895 RepID=UPI0039E34086